ncbi:hypothetical protein HPB51_005407 [Rhipicephalus microplus]|uniref:THAP-type domain-containing protein n=1 Tax=Rhipicephalus microplus TaxID=6941 RepID=A0A9J6DZY5_RHIMP|nr:hypothetical protein HPB51_005407 [Rhipicephalus microplus]
MPNKCCVPGCTGNYKTGKKIQVFSFSKDADALKQWLHAIPRKDFVPTSCTKVCADHFDASCIEKTTAYTDPRTRRVIEVALPVPRLRPASVPTVFPGCPSYLPVRDQSTRETPDAKRSRQEASQLARAVEESLVSYEAEQERDRFSSLEELRARLQGVSVSPKWTVIHKEECSMFLNIIDYREPCLNASLTVFANHEVFACCYQGSLIKNLGSAVVPDSVQKADPFESRFGQYRQMAGEQYHISVRQLCETEGRIRLQNALPRMSNDDLRGIEETDSVRDAGTSFSVHVSDADLDELRAQMPLIGYVGGTQEDVVVDNIFIPRGTVVLFNLWAVSRDDSLWRNPHHFDPTRYLRDDGSLIREKPAHHVGFSYGKRSCPGESFAMMQLFLMVAFTLQRYNVHLGEPLSCDLDDPEIDLGVLKRMRLRFERRLRNTIACDNAFE